MHALCMLVLYIYEYATIVHVKLNTVRVGTKTWQVIHQRSFIHPTVLVSASISMQSSLHAPQISWPYKAEIYVIAGQESKNYSHPLVDNVGGYQKHRNTPDWWV